MSVFNYRRSGISTFLLLALATCSVTPFLSSKPAAAQLFPGQRNDNDTNNDISPSRTVTIPAGTTLPVEYDEAEKIVVTKEETVDLTLNVAANIKDRRGRILIPYGSQIKGQLQPQGEGSQFVAQELVIAEGETTTTQPLEGESEVVTRTETIDQGTDVGSILQGAAVGAAAAAIIALITGDNSIDILEVLGGAGLGAVGGILLGGQKQAEVISINPNEDLDVTLTEDLTVEP